MPPETWCSNWFFIALTIPSGMVMHTSARPSVSNRTEATSDLTPVRTLLTPACLPANLHTILWTPSMHFFDFFFDIILIFKINIREIKNQIYSAVIDYKSKPVLGRQLVNNELNCLLNQIQFPSPPYIHSCL